MFTMTASYWELPTRPPTIYPEKEMTDKLRGKSVCFTGRCHDFTAKADTRQPQLNCSITLHICQVMRFASQVNSAKRLHAATCVASLGWHGNPLQFGVQDVYRGTSCKTLSSIVIGRVIQLCCH